MKEIKRAQPEPTLDRVFYDENGKLYKAKKAARPDHAEVNFPTGDMLKALDTTPITREEMISKINHPEFNKTDAVLDE